MLFVQIAKAPLCQISNWKYWNPIFLVIEIEVLALKKNLHFTINNTYKYIEYIVGK